MTQIQTNGYVISEDGAVVEEATGKVMYSLPFKATLVHGKNGDFMGYNALSGRDLRFVNMAFCRDCAGATLPEENGTYILVTEKNAVSVDMRRLYPKIYIHKVIAIVPYDGGYINNFAI